ncbi:MAG: hypothetical protein F6K58_04650 [Symploca sp. SIO2E9]|nr:hypothetical protein [Symploca sp. SIO2E9]
MKEQKIIHHIYPNSEFNLIHNLNNYPQDEKITIKKQSSLAGLLTKLLLYWSDTSFEDIAKSVFF